MMFNCMLFTHINGLPDFMCHRLALLMAVCPRLHEKDHTMSQTWLVRCGDLRIRSERAITFATQIVTRFILKDCIGSMFAHVAR
jgi:hypothetical protein